MRRASFIVVLCLSLSVVGAAAAATLAKTMGRAKPAAGCTSVTANAARATTGRSPILFGQRTIGSATAQTPAGMGEMFSFDSRMTGTASSIDVYIDSHNLARSVMVALYQASGCRAGKRLTSGLLTRVKAGAWNLVHVRRTAVVAGRMYWLLVLGRGGTLRLRSRNASGCTSMTSAQTGLSSPPAHWQAGMRHNGCRISAYATGSMATIVHGTLGTANPTTTATQAAGGTATSVSTTVDSLLPGIAAPDNTGPPAISGTPVVGDGLTTTTGTWDGSPLTYAYQWEDCDASGNNCTINLTAISNTYALSSSDVGHTIRSIVTAVKPVVHLRHLAADGRRTGVAAGGAGEFGVAGG